MAVFSKEEVSRIWLSFADLPPNKVAVIMKTFGSALSFFQAFNRKMWDIIPPAAYQALKTMYQRDALVAELEKLHAMDIDVITDEKMPPLLKGLETPPILLYVKGDASLLESEKSIAIVGTRSPTKVGKMAAEEMAASLSQSRVTIVNGFARGIDTMAQEGCLRAKGKGVALMGNGLDAVYPPENEALLKGLLDNGGLVVSEYPPGALPLPQHFPQRNRLISALASGLLFIEGKRDGGGMITVNHALEQGKEVFVLPGPTNSELYEAPHQLIRDGARLVTSADDILADMGWEKAGRADTAEGEAESELSPEQAAIAQLLDKGELSFEEIAENTQQSAALLNSNLTIMELAGIIKKSAGRIFMKVKR